MLTIFTKTKLWSQSVIAAVLTVIFLSPVYAQNVNVSNAHPSSNGTYATLNAAFNAINSQIQTGNDISVEIVASTTETVSSVLTNGAWNSLRVFPSTTGITVAGSITTPLINLDGAAKVTIDGREGGASGGAPHSLTLRNSNTTTGTTIQFINSAITDTVQYVRIEGSNTTTTSGVVLFSTATAAPGNNSNVIRNNLLTNAGGNRPVNLLYSAGTATRSNTGNKIENNQFFDGFRLSTNSSSIELAANNADWIISGNSFYETATMTTTFSGNYHFIYVSNATALGTQISGNFMGGSAASAGGTPFTKNGNNNLFCAIRVLTGTASATTIDGNVVTNMSWTNSSNLGWFGINVEGGTVQIGETTGNTIGAASGTGSIYIQGGGAAVTIPEYFGIRVQTTAPATASIKNSIIGSITTDRSDTQYATRFFGISASSNGSVTIEDNLIGNTTQANSILSQSVSSLNSSDFANQQLYGIFSTISGNITISGNTIANLTNATTNNGVARAGLVQGIYSSNGINIIENNTIHGLTISNANNTDAITASVAGIMASAGTRKTIRGNTIYNLRNNFTDFSGNIYGIYFTGATGANNGAYKNFIHSLNAPNNSGTVAANIFGIRQINNLVAEFSNNIISLQGNNTANIYGFYENGNTGTSNIYHNTIYIGGAASSGSASSFAFFSNNATAQQNISNNIFNNLRTGGTGTNYAIRLAGSGTLNINHNNYYTSNTGVTGFLTTDRATLSDWQSATSQDFASSTFDPELDNPGGTASADYIPASANLIGNTTLGVADDFDGTTRTFFSKGAFEVSVNPIITINATSGLATANYANLNAAITSINSGVHQGNIDVLIHLSHGLTTSAVLNASGVGGSNYTNIRIFPTAENVVVSGNMATPLIDLNGAINVTFDGRVNGVSMGNPHALVFRNISTSATAGTSTIRFINGASNDTIQYVRVEGSTTATASGVIFLSTSTAPAGNNDNVIHYNLITNAGGNRAVNSLYALGTAAKFNTGNKFENNEVFNFFNLGITSTGVLIAGNNTDWTIRKNSFYETGTLVPTTTTTYTAIHLNSANIVNSVVSGNFIGGSQALAGGSTFTKTGNNNTFYGIRLTVGTTSVTSVDSNFVTNMSWANSSNAEWFGIRLDAGLANIGSNYGNTIGAATGTGSIYLEGGSTTVIPNYYGISTNSANNVNIANNVIASITTNRSNTGYGTQFFGIHRTAGSTTNIENNTIGSSSQANSIWSQSISNLNSSFAAQIMYGIFNSGAGTLNVIGNTIANLTNATSNTNVGIAGFVQGITSTSTSGTNLIQNNNIHNLSISSANNLATTSASLAGIMLSGSSVKSVRENNIYNLTNSFTDFAGHIYGVHFLGTTGSGNGVFRNFIHSLNAPNNTGTVAATVYGVRILSNGVATIQNNIISLANDNTTLVYGIFDNSTAGNANVYHNTVYVSGNPTNGSANSFGLWANAVAGIQDYRNNIFSNERAGGSGNHYAIGLSGTSALTINNNAYFVGNTGVTGFLTTDQNTLVDWQAATGQDDFSIDTDPDFDNAGGLAALDYMPNATNLIGNLFLGVTDDYSGAARSTFSMGAYDVALDVIVTVNSTLGLPTDNYSTLKDAFDKINDGTHQGDIEVQIHVGHTNNATALLNGSGIGAANYTSVRVYPTDENVLVSANIAAPLIDLNGANNVTFDGRVNGVSSGNPHALTLRNSNGLTTAGNSTVRFINGASNDTIQYVRIEGSTTATASGVIFLSTSTAPAGNNNNVIQHNLITNAVGNRAVNSLYSAGTASKFNTGNKFENNEVFNFFRQSSNSTGVLVEANNTAWTIRNNSFYETASLIPTTGTAYTAVHLNSTNIVNSVISGNFIGGTQALAGGAPLTKIGNNTPFYGIRLNVGSSSVTSVDSNFITNMSWSNSSNAEWFGIRLEAGLINVGSTHGNTIGAATGTGSIYIEGGSTTVIPSYYGISTNSANNVNIQNNVIASITTNRSNTGYGTQFYGIHRTGGAITNIENNTIGSSSQANSIWSQSISNLNSSFAAQIMYGIFNSGAGTLNVSGNTIANLTNATSNPNLGIAGFVQGITSTSTSGTNLIQNNNIYNLSISSSNNSSLTSASLAGMMLTGATVKSVRENTIYNLSNSFTDFTGSVYGIYFTGTTGTGNGVFRNFIHSLNVPNNTDAVSATIYGIRQVSSNVATLANNIVALDNDNTALVYGIFDNATAGTANMYQNTIYVGGNPTDGAANSYALWANATAGVQDYRNNILYNGRAGGSGTHYAIGLSGTTSLTIDNNNYYAGNTGVLGFLAGNQNTLADWQTATGQDGFSVDTDPDFDNAGGTNALDYMPNASNLVGNMFLGIADDYTGAARVNFSMGAFDVALDAVVTVNATLGTPTADYLNLTEAFNSINDGTHQGEIEVLINLGHTLSVSTVLNGSGIGAADYTSVRVYPTDDNIVVTSNIAGAMIDLNGANNVTFDGRVNGVSSGNPYALTLRNANTSATANNATIRFINGASNDTIQYVRIEGSSTATTSGVIFLSTSTAPAGNNDNVIQNNLITNAGGNRAVNSLHSLGTAAKFNTGNKFEYNEMFNFFNQGLTSTGVSIAGNNTDWIIRNNSFYETGTLVQTSITTYTAIHLNSANIVNSVVSGNFIGGSQAQAGGAPFSKTSNNATFYGIRLTVGTSSVTEVDSNIITNISWINTASVDWFGIRVDGGLVNVGTNNGNIIGAATGTGAVHIQGGGLFNTPIYYGISVASTNTVNVQNNIIASISNTRTNTDYATHFYGIHKINSGICNILDNTIGSTTQANSIWSQSISNINNSASDQRIIGIACASTGTITISGNTIANLTNATTNPTTSRLGYTHGISSSAGTNIIENNIIHDLSIANSNTNATTSASLAGIMLSGSTVKSVRDNTIYNLSNTFTDFAGSIYGIHFVGTTGTGNGLYRNFIHSISVPNNNASVAATIYGMRQVTSGVATIANNIVSLQGDNTALVYGMFDDALTGTGNFYHNTVYLGGNPTSGSAASYAFWANSTSATQDYRNNIFFNERTGGSGTHYAIRLAGNTTTTINNNAYYSTGVLGFLTTDRNTLADWQTATGQDGFSVDTDPDFDNAGGTSAADYIPNASNLVGNLFTGITDDYTGAARTVFSMGAFDVDVDPAVTVNASAGLATADYLTLTDAFNSINNGTHQGDIEVLINLGHSLNVSSVLNASGIGSADYTSIRVFPSVDNILVTSNIAGAMIDLNGANNVTIDGRVNGVSSGNPHALTLRNANTSATAGNSTIRFINGASNDTIQYVRLEGSTTVATSGIIFLSTSTAVAGNNNNVIQHNLITNAGGNRAVNSLYSLGTAAKFNTDNKFENNEVFNFFRPQSNSNGLLVEANNTAWTIRNNSFYETGVLSPTATTTYTAIYLNSANIVNSVVSGNFIGGSQALAGGSSFVKTGSNNAFFGIRLSVGTTTVSTVDSNSVTNMSWTNNSNAEWHGIRIDAGLVDVGSTHGNTIGATTGTGSIYIEGGSTTVIPNYYGISTYSTSNVKIENNTIASITTNRSNQGYATQFYGIFRNAGTTTNIANNTIGSSTQANSIWSQSESNLNTTSSNQLMYGIYNVGAGTVNIVGNTIANLTNATNNAFVGRAGFIHGIVSSTGTNLIEGNAIHNFTIANANNNATTSAALAGIMLTGATVKSVRENTIYNLSNSYSDFTGTLYGIYFTGTTSAGNGVFRNFIHSLNVPNNTTAAAANIYGIRQVSSGVANFQNNIIALQNDNTANMFGLYDNGTTGTTNFHNNTVYIAGEPTSGSSESFALFSNAITATQNYRNNILVNEREGGSGSHYAVRLAGTSTLTIDQNLYRVGGTGITGFLGSDQATLSDWQIATSQDQGSLDLDPQFVNAGSTVAADYLPQEDLLVGANIPTVADDFSGSARTFYAMGAWEYPVAYLWRGGGAGIPTAWNNALNWTPQAVPPTGFAVKFENNGNGHNLVLDQNRSAFFIDFNGANKKIEVGNFDLTVSDDFSGANENNFVIAAGSGVLRRANLGDGESFVFPIGGSQYNPVTITNNSGAADDFTARVLDAVYEGGLSGNLIDVPHLAVTWDLGKANPNGGSGLDFIFQWHVDQETDVMTDYALNHHNGINWEIAAGTSGTPIGATVKTMSHTGYTGSFSPFAVGPSFDSALPVELIGIQVNCLNDGKNTEITWQTASELNSDKFIIERSNDGLTWEAISFIQGAGTTTQLSQYSFVDAQTRSSRVVYYRLTQVDFDGASRTYPPVSSDCEMTEEIVLFPNPAREQVFVQMINAQDENIRVEIRNHIGSLISAHNYKLIEGINMLNMDINNLSVGQYIIVIQSENKEPRMVKFIKSE